MANVAKKVFVTNGTFTPPAGVFSVTVVTEYDPLVLSASLGAQGVNPFGQAFAWGSNTAGQLGISSVTPVSSPTLVVGGNIFVKVMATNNTTDISTFGIDTNGKLWGWGRNNNGQLGDGSTTDRSSPVAVLGNLTFIDVWPAQPSAGAGGSTYAISSTGQAYAWGFNTNGELGVGDVTPRSSPVAVAGTQVFKQIISNGQSSVFGLNTAGLLYAWGLNANGELGLGDVTPRSSPVAVLEGLTFQAVIPAYGGNVGGSHIMGLTQAGAAYAWGLNANGQLGLGDVNSRSSPVAVLEALTFTKLVATTASSFGLTTAGAAYAWGQNTNGQLGLGDVNPRSSPVAVLGGLTFASIYSLGNNNASYGLTAAGTAYAWGINAHGQLGLNDVTPRSSPVAVVGGLSFAQLIPGYSSATNVMYATSTANALYAWGRNTLGQIGDGTSTDKSSPVAVIATLFTPNQQPKINTTRITVVPNTSYSINLMQANPSFGSTVLGLGVPTSITVFFDE